MKKRIVKIALAIYGILMLWLLFGQRMGQPSFDDYAQQLRTNLNLYPFDTVGRYLWVLRNSVDPALIRTDSCCPAYGRGCGGLDGTSF